MALQGTIDAFPVADVLHLLAGSRKTGRLIVEGDRSTAQIFVSDGAITAGSVRDVDSVDLADVVVELLRYRAGSFLFEPGAPPPLDGEEQDLVDVVATAVERVAAWSEIEAAVPSTAHRLGLAASIDVEGVHLTAEDWPAIVAAGAQLRVADLIASQGLPEIVTCGRIAELVARGLVSVEGPAAELVPLGSPIRPASRPDPEPAPDAGAAPGPESFPSPPGLHHDDSVEEVPAFEVVLLDDEASTDAAFPEHFPIDDLIGSEAEDDPWVQLENAARQDRLAAAQTFDQRVDARSQDPGPSEVGVAPAASASFDGTGAFTDEPVTGPLDGSAPGFGTAEVDSAADEVLRQMSKLSPKAAEAIAAALGASGGAAADGHDQRVVEDGYGVPFGGGSGF